DTCHPPSTTHRHTHTQIYRHAYTHTNTHRHSYTHRYSFTLSVSPTHLGVCAHLPSTSGLTKGALCSVGLTVCLSSTPAWIMSWLMCVCVCVCVCGGGVCVWCVCVCVCKWKGKKLQSNELPRRHDGGESRTTDYPH